MDKSKNLYIVTCVHEHTGQRRVRLIELSKLAEAIDVLIGVGCVIDTIVQANADNLIEFSQKPLS